MKFTKCLIRTEVHSKEYGGVRSSRSYHIAVKYLEGDEEKESFGEVNKFFKVTVKDRVVRLALVTCFKPQPGYTHRLRNEIYKTGRVVDVLSIDRKVIFHAVGTTTRVLEVPLHM